MPFIALCISLFCAVLFTAAPTQACMMSDSTVADQFRNKDGDNNGSLNLDEYYKNIPQKFVPQKKREEYIKTIDTDKNGLISIEEFKADKKNTRCGG